MPPIADNGTSSVDAISTRYRKAVERRSSWRDTWRDCYANALPQRESSIEASAPGGIKTATLYDGTAPDAVEQLAASLLSELTPPRSRWFALAPGREMQDIDDDERDEIDASLEDTSERIRDHFERSNFAVEIHQAYLDLVTVGTASLLFEEAPLGEASAFRFTAVPLGQVAFEEGDDGRLETTFRQNSLTREQLRRRFPGITDPGKSSGESPDKTMSVVESVTRETNGRFARLIERQDGSLSTRADSVHRRAERSCDHDDQRVGDQRFAESDLHSLKASDVL